jgi:hypothetical protein
MRIVAMVLAIGAIFIPFATVEANFSTFSAKLSFGAFGIYQAFTDGTLSAIFNLSEYTPGLSFSLFMLLIFIALIFAIPMFVLILVSIIKSRKWAFEYNYKLFCERLQAL